MKKEFIINLQGKNYPIYAGILDEAHQKGLTKISTVLVQIPSKENEYTAITKAIVFFKTEQGEKIFEAYGDASPRNVNSRIAAALIRMSETRAKGRALRDAVNCGETMAEELSPEANMTNEERFIAELEKDEPLNQTQLGIVPKCPNCSGEMYDNRLNKTNPKSPDFRCKDKTCLDEKGFITSIWLKK